MNFFIGFSLLLWSWACLSQDVSTLLVDEKPYTKEELFKSLEGKKITNVEQFIAALPEKIRKNYVIVYESQSLQSASFKKPRVIVRSPLSDVMLTFTDPQGSSNEHDSNIEMMYWDKKEKAFKMQEITFDKKGYKLSGVNPPACLKCHGDDPRPNWEPYSTWPGVYGGNAEFRFGAELVKGERKYLDEFIEAAPKSPVYKHLIGLKDNFTVEKSFTGGEEAKGFMNYKFTESLTKLNFQRIVRTMMANPNYERFKYATLYTAACSNSPSPYPKSLEDFDILINKTGANDLIELYQTLGTDTSKWSMSFLGGADKGIRLASPDGERQDMTFALMAEDKDLWPYFDKKDPLAWEKDSFWQYGEKDVLCNKLLEKSKESLQGLTSEVVCSKEEQNRLKELTKSINAVLKEVSKGNAEKGKNVVFGLCMSCHTEDNVGPDFFNDESALKKHINENPNFVEKVAKRLKGIPSVMPPGNKLSDATQADVLEYLNSFYKP